MHRCRVYLAVLGTCLILGSLSLQAQYTPGFPKEEFAGRRATFYEKIPDGIAVFLGALTPSGIDSFRQNNNFFYLSGVETPNAILILDGTAKKSHLFVPGFTPRERRAEGPQLEPGEKAQELTGIDGVHPLDGFIPMLIGLSAGAEKAVYVSMWPEELPAADSAFAQFLKQQQPWDSRLSRSGYFVRWFRERFPAATIKSYDQIMHALRRVKSPAEIDAMRQAGHLTALGANEAIRATEPGMYEYEIAAATDFIYASGGAQRLAFAHIAASGANGNIWHYFANKSRMKAGDVVLLDTGAEYNYYAADLTRTWPVSGRFTPEQEKMYRCVLDASKTVIAAIRPGVSMMELSRIAKEVYEKHGFGDIGPPTGRSGRPYIGHLVGLSVHDVGDPNQPFVPGVVFNVEPILEIPEKGIHIRLEDTVVVTEDGHENMTGESPVEVEDLYHLYNEKSRLFPGGKSRAGNPASDSRTTGRN